MTDFIQFEMHVVDWDMRLKFLGEKWLFHLDLNSFLDAMSIGCTTLILMQGYQNFFPWFL